MAYKGREIREGEGITQVQLCREIGMDQGKLSLIENGRYIPHLVTLQRLSWGLSRLAGKEFKMWDLWEDEPPTKTLTDPRYRGRADRGKRPKPKKKRAGT